MIFEQFYLASLGHASYLIASEETGEALVLDARRDVDTYFAAAQRHGVKITYACDTHQHNDYLTGICELPVRGNVQLLAGERAELEYPVRRLRDGERMMLGEVVIEVLHTPGHTPEHIALLVTDRARGDGPSILFSGGILLVGDVARPDLLGGTEQAQKHAQELCQSLREKILTLPDHVEVYPTHVYGSLCGGRIASRLSTTIGFERRTNPMLSTASAAEAFVDRCIDFQGLPAIPPYWRHMRSQNQNGPAPLGVVRDVPPLTVAQFEARINEGAVVLDCRSTEAFSAHIPSALNVPAGRSFPTWAGTVLPYGAETLLVVDDVSMVSEIVWSLLRIGYDAPKGWLAGGINAWRSHAKPLSFMSLWTVLDLYHGYQADPDLVILDVRQPAEWRSGHIKRALHITAAELPMRQEEVPRDRPVAVVCSSGLRSGISASLLQHHGHRRVLNVLGGMSAWRNAGFEFTTD